MVAASVRGHSASGEQLELLFNEVLEYEIAQVSQPGSQQTLYNGQPGHSRHVQPHRREGESGWLRAWGCGLQAPDFRSSG